MRIFVFEDDREFAERLECLIRKYTHHPTAINTGDAAELARWVSQASEPGLYLLDIVMDDNTPGFHLARKIAEQQKGDIIVFMTAYPKSIRHNSYFKTLAFCIIIKDSPILDKEIKNTIYRAEKCLLSQCLYIHTGKSETMYIPYANICYIDAIKGTNKLCVHCVNGQYIIRDTLKAMQERLASSGFVRCHKSILVNTANIRKRDKASMTLTFEGGASCPYSYNMKGALDRT